LYGWNTCRRVKDKQREHKKENPTKREKDGMHVAFAKRQEEKKEERNKKTNKEKG
jgi:hypothetical protein